MRPNCTLKSDFCPKNLCLDPESSKNHTIFKSDMQEIIRRPDVRLIADDRKPAPEVYLIGDRMSENREKHPRGLKIASTFF